MRNQDTTRRWAQARRTEARRGVEHSGLGAGARARRQAGGGTARRGARARCDTVGPGHDTVGPRPVTLPLELHNMAPMRVPGHACEHRLGQVGALCT